MGPGPGDGSSRIWGNTCTSSTLASGTKKPTWRRCKPHRVPVGGGGVGQGRGSGLGGLEAGGMGEVMCRWREGASSPSPPQSGLGVTLRATRHGFPAPSGSLPPSAHPHSAASSFLCFPLFCLLFHVEMPALRTGLFWGGEPSSPRVGHVLAGKATPSGGGPGPPAFLPLGSAGSGSPWRHMWLPVSRL